MNLLFFETSAKSGQNIKTLFNELAKKLTGIETDPIPNANEQAKGFVLGSQNVEVTEKSATDQKKQMPKKSSNKKCQC